MNRDGGVRSRGCGELGLGFSSRGCGIPRQEQTKQARLKNVPYRFVCVRVYNHKVLDLGFRVHRAHSGEQSSQRGCHFCTVVTHHPGIPFHSWHSFGSCGGPQGPRPITTHRLTRQVNLSISFRLGVWSCVWGIGGRVSQSL